MSDGELVVQAAAGDMAAAEQLLRRWSARVFLVCRGRVGRLDVAEDLAQESLLRGMRGLQKLGDPEKFGAWICGIATRTCLDWLKDIRRREVNFDPLSGHEPAANEPANDTQDVQRLMSEVARLPVPYQETLMLYYSNDYTYEQLAELLGVSAATVNVRLTKARRILRERLTKSES